MTIVTEWALKLAETAVPDEIDLASDLADAYQQGGAARNALYQKRDSQGVAGGFGAGDMTFVLPWIFKGLRLAAQKLLSILVSDELSNMVSVTKEAIALKASMEKSPQQTTSSALLPGQKYPELKQTMDILVRELRAAGLSDDQADLTTFRVIKALLDEPESGAEFVNCLYGAES